MVSPVSCRTPEVQRPLRAARRILPKSAHNDKRPDARLNVVSGAHYLRRKQASDAESLIHNARSMRRTRLSGVYSNEAMPARDETADIKRGGSSKISRQKTLRWQPAAAGSSHDQCGIMRRPDPAVWRRCSKLYTRCSSPAGHLASSCRRILPVVLRGTCSEVTNSINRGRL